MFSMSVLWLLLLLLFYAPFQRKPLSRLNEASPNSGSTSPRAPLPPQRSGLLIVAITGLGEGKRISLLRYFNRKNPETTSMFKKKASNIQYPKLIYHLKLHTERIYQEHQEKKQQNMKKDKKKHRTERKTKQHPLFTHQKHQEKY